MRVTYTRAWLQCVTNGDPTSELWHRFGTVVGESPPWLLVLWDGDAEPIPVRPENLAPPDSAAALSVDAKNWGGHAPVCKKPYSPWKVHL